MAGTIGTLDVNSIVNTLMEKQSGQLNRLTAEEKNQEIKLSIYGQLQNFITNLKQAIEGVRTAFNTVSYSASVGNSNVISASILSNSNVYAGTHSIHVNTLASSETISSDAAYPSRNQTLGLSGDLGFTIGSNSFTVNVSATDTLENIRDHINQGANNVGVTASITASTDGSGNNIYKLILSSNNTGNANAFTLSGSLASGFTTVINQANDATFTVDGNNVVRSQNNISDVLDGISFNLLGLGDSTLVVNHDGSAQTKAVVTSVQAVVDAYNKVMDYIAQNKADQTLTDSSIDMIKTRLINLVNSQFQNVGGMQSLLDIGIGLAPTSNSVSNAGTDYVTTNALTLNTDKLNSLLANNADMVKAFFSTNNTGFVDVASSGLSQMTEFDGIIPTNQTWIKENITQLNRNIDTENSRLTDMRAVLIDKYSKLNEILSKYDRLGTMLDGALSHLNPSGKK